MEENKLVLRMLKMIENDIIMMREYAEPERIEGMEHVKMDNYLNTPCTSASKAPLITKENLDELIESLRPEIAIMINKYVANGKMFEIDNHDFKKYYCKKLWIMDKETYLKRIKPIEHELNRPIKVYEQE